MIKTPEPRLARAASLALTLALGWTGSVPAQGLPGGANSLNETHGDWTVACVAPEGVARCAMTQTQVQGESRERVLAIELTTADGGDGVTGLLVLPFGLNLDAGITLAIDEATELDPRRFSTCLPAGCLVPIAFDGNAYARLRAGTTVMVRANANGSTPEVTFTVSLNGFASASSRLDQLGQ
ncbi:invasion associated locus B family protein [Pelagibacterium montanilacus]|uniref:invasion associated locus B family protein n=1 Tax=Pelagibacterium montanilacus TaxID=2185280 RepID=UPI000F8CA29E|nr:invasion associated locus B family protein [Pelagibacterium montanilacus]